MALFDIILLFHFNFGKKIVKTCVFIIISCIKHLSIAVLLNLVLFALLLLNFGQSMPVLANTPIYPINISGM